MKKNSGHRVLTGAVLAAFFLQVLSVSAQERQVAVEHLEEYVAIQENAGMDRTSALATLIAGSTVAAGGVGLYFLSGDDRWDLTTRVTITGTMTATGLVAAGVGGAMLVGQSVDYRSRYEHIFTQPIASLRERQAAEALFELADSAYRRRRLTGLVKIAIPILTVGSTLTANAILEEREWYQDLPTVGFTQVWSLVSGISDLMRMSPEERLYRRYLREEARGD